MLYTIPIRIRLLLKQVLLTAVIPVKLSDEDVRSLDYLVRAGFFKNRSEAIRSILKAGVSQKLRFAVVEADSEVDSIIKTMMELKAKGVDVFRIHSRKTAAEIVAEGRERS